MNKVRSLWIKAVLVFLLNHVEAQVTWAVTSFILTDYVDANESYYIKDNEQVSLVCSYSNLDPEKLRYIRWNKVDPVNPQNTEQVYFSQNNDHVTGSLKERATSQIQDGGTWINIFHFNRTLDATTYQCIVCDTDITCHSTVLDLHGVRLLELPQVSVIGPDFTITEGDNFTLVCSVTGGYPIESPSRYSWTFQTMYEDIVNSPGNRKPDELGEHNFLHTFSGKEVLLKGASYDYHGLFQCEAEVVAGIVSNTTIVSVYYSPYLLNSSIDQTVHQTIGSDVILDIAFRSHSNYGISVNWKSISAGGFHIGDLQYSVTEIKYLRDAYFTSLELSNIDFSDFGVYRCEIYNGLLSTAVKQFRLALDVPSVLQESLVYSKKNSLVSLSWNTPEGPYTEVSVLRCGIAPTQCTEHKVTDPHTTNTLEINVDDNSDYSYYLVLYQNAVEVFRSDPFVLLQENNDSVYGIIAGLTAAVIITIVIVVPVCVIKVTNCRRNEKNGVNMSSKEKISRWVTRMRKSFKRSKKKTRTDVTLSDIDEETETQTTEQGITPTFSDDNECKYAVKKSETDLTQTPTTDGNCEKLKETNIHSNEENIYDKDDIFVRETGKEKVEHGSNTACETGSVHLDIVSGPDSILNLTSDSTGWSNSVTTSAGIQQGDNTCITEDNCTIPKESVIDVSTKPNNEGQIGISDGPVQMSDFHIIKAIDMPNNDHPVSTTSTSQAIPVVVKQSVLASNNNESEDLKYDENNIAPDSQTEESHSIISGMDDNVSECDEAMQVICGPDIPSGDLHYEESPKNSEPAPDTLSDTNNKRSTPMDISMLPLSVDDLQQCENDANKKHGLTRESVKPDNVTCQPEYFQSDHHYCQKSTSRDNAFFECGVSTKTVAVKDLADANMKTIGTSCDTQSLDDTADDSVQTEDSDEFHPAVYEV